MEVKSYTLKEMAEKSIKADEYEAKAKLADELISELKDSSYYVDTGTKDLMISMCLTKIKRYESGERDE